MSEEEAQDVQDELDYLFELKRAHAQFINILDKRIGKQQSRLFKAKWSVDGKKKKVVTNAK